MRAQFVDQSFSELRISPFAEHAPKFLIRQILKSCNLQLQQVILVRIQIHCMNSSRICRCHIIEQVVASARQTKYHVVVIDLQKTLVNPRIFPGESIEIVIVELGMLFELLVIVDPSLMVLIERARKRKVCA